MLLEDLGNKSRLHFVKYNITKQLRNCPVAMGKSESTTHVGMKNLCNRYLHVGKILCRDDGTVVQI